MAEKIVLAYSGGLDTTVAVKWLIEERGFDVVALTIDLGSQPDLAAIRQRALTAGASRAYVLDARRPFIERFCWPALRAGALYQGQYPLATALGRPLIAQLLVEVAAREGATWVAHGSTGKGNDQVRFDVAVGALAPRLKVLAPLRDGMSMTREEEIAYARAHQLPIDVKPESPYSVDENLWGRSIEAGVLEDALLTPPEDAFRWTSSVDNAPASPTVLELDFEKGVPTALDGDVFPSPSGGGQGGGVALVSELNRIGGLHGIGRIDMIEDRFVGIKSREVYEAPAAVILLAAHKALEDLVLDGETARFKPSVAQEYARLVYQGKWFTSHRRDLDAYVLSTQQAVSGRVRIKLHKGSAQVVGRSSPNSLYRPKLATYSAGDQFDHQAAVGFIKLVGLPVRTQAEVQGIAETEPLLEDDRHVVEVGPGSLELSLAEPVLRAAVPGVVDSDLGR
ncbi:MAG TPA: argininosuccinate synthase [Candidatus Dormibacteraeota bacterium]|nr:argininosuccinate synthase [Candidatus Dormibacteraeota bacterium]